MSNHLTRRQWIASTATALTVPYWFTSACAVAAPSKNDRPVAAVIGTGGRGRTVIAPAIMCAVQVASGELPKQPTFRLNDSRQVVNLSEHDPHTVHLLWAGRQDLSAEVRLARVERGLKVQVDVQDNVHYSATGNNPSTQT